MRSGEMSYQWHANLLVWLDVIIRCSLAAVFLFAAIPKLFHPVAFAEIIEVYDILPGFLVLPVAVVLPLLEIVLAVGLALGKKLCSYSIALLLLFFIGLLSYGIWIGLDVDCGCFGPNEPEAKAYHGLRSALVRDVVMLFFLLCSVFYQKYLAEK